MNITILGNVCIDKNTSENTSYTGLGGPPSFMYKILKQFPNATAEIIAPYGHDFLEFAKDLPLKNEPVSHSTLVYENVTKQGKRTQKAFNVELAGFSDIPSRESNADLLIVAPLHSNLSHSDIQKMLPNEKTIPVILLPQGYFRSFGEDNVVSPREFAEFQEILPLIDFVILSDQDHPRAYEMGREWADNQNVTVIITQGERGAAIIEPLKPLYEVGTDPVNEADIVDSVGSGDIFSISFSYKFAQSRDLPSAVAFANSIARQCLFNDSEHLEVNIEEAEAASRRN